MANKPTTIKAGIFELFRSKGYKNVTNEMALKIARQIKPDTRWNITHLYYWRKVWKTLVAEGSEKDGPKSRSPRKRSTKKVTDKE